MIGRTWFTILSAILVVVAVGGCAPKGTPPVESGVQNAAPTESEDHHHGIGPHGGTVADWGGGAYHVEFMVDHDKREATVYILGGDGKSPAPVAAEKIQLSINEPPLQLDLLAQPLEGESDGKSSRFVGQHDSLGTVREFEGTITGQVNGTPYSGDFQEEAGGHSHS